jgi:hypothetical protein
VPSGAITTAWSLTTETGTVTVGPDWVPWVSVPELERASVTWVVPLAQYQTSSVSVGANPGVRDRGVEVIPVRSIPVSLTSTA